MLHHRSAATVAFGLKAKWPDAEAVTIASTFMTIQRDDQRARSTAVLRVRLDIHERTGFSRTRLRAV